MGRAGYGTTLVGGTNFTAGISGIKDITLSGLECDAIDVTDMDSTGRRREYVPGLIEPGEITFTVNFEDGLYDTVLDKMGGGTAAAAETWTVTFPDDSTYACSGFLSKAGSATPHDGGITFDMTIKLSGAETFTTAA